MPYAPKPATADASHCSPVAAQSTGARQSGQPPPRSAIGCGRAGEERFSFLISLMQPGLYKGYTGEYGERMRWGEGAKGAPGRKRRGRSGRSRS
jgi:hypothetical protein